MKDSTISRCFIPDDKDVYQLAEISEQDGEIVTVLSSKGKKVVALKATFPASCLTEELENPPSDLIKLSVVHIPSILHSLRLRFLKDIVYTSVGPILVALNPFKWISGLYDVEEMQKFSTERESLSSNPHVFGIAYQALKGLHLHHNQSIIISGESGAGKTETTKQCLNFFAKTAESTNGVHNLILEASPILEAWGNAKTLRNNNSSRFGKFIEIWFDSTFRIVGASNTTYLLEKSRVVYQDKNERNYHIFYQLLKGADSALRAQLGFEEKIDLGSFRYIGQSGCFDLDDINDSLDFSHVVRSFELLQFSPDIIHSLLSVILGILYLGNVEFNSVSDASGDYCKISEGSINSLQQCSRLFSIDYEALRLSILHKKIKTGARKSISLANYTIEQAIETRDALAKEIYNRCFDYIVSHINEIVNRNRENAVNMIGVLDIFGFEIFQKNSFEQLCINLANESLQQHFNINIFHKELELYKTEEVPLPSLNFQDNQDVLDLITKRPQGILPTLDEEGLIPKGSWEGFLSKIVKNHHPNHPRFKNKHISKHFAVKHYAGEVIYDPSLFLLKNKDTLPLDVIEVLGISESPFIASMFRMDEQASSSSKNNKMTVGRKFSLQLESLIQNLNSTMPHYIRCIKPNQVKKPNIFDAGIVNEQLMYSGVFESVLIMQSGYPFRMKLDEFRQYFHLFVMDREIRETIFGISVDKKRCLPSRAGKSNIEALIDHCISHGHEAFSQCHIGKSMVFYRSEQHIYLNKIRSAIVSNAILRLQTFCRMYVYCKLYNILLLSKRKCLSAMVAFDLNSIVKQSSIASDALLRINKLRNETYVVPTIDFGRQLASVLEKKNSYLSKLSQFLSSFESIFKHYSSIVSLLEELKLCLNFQCQIGDTKIAFSWNVVKEFVEASNGINAIKIRYELKHSLIGANKDFDEISIANILRKIEEEVLHAPPIPAIDIDFSAVISESKCILESTNEYLSIFLSKTKEYVFAEHFELSRSLGDHEISVISASTKLGELCDNFAKAKRKENEDSIDEDIVLARRLCLSKRVMVCLASISYFDKIKRLVYSNDYEGLYEVIRPYVSEFQQFLSIKDSQSDDLFLTSTSISEQFIYIVPSCWKLLDYFDCDIQSFFLKEFHLAMIFYFERKFVPLVMKEMARNCIPYQTNVESVIDISFNEFERLIEGVSIDFNVCDHWMKQLFHLASLKLKLRKFSYQRNLHEMKKAVDLFENFISNSLRDERPALQNDTDLVNGKRYLNLLMSFHNFSLGIEKGPIGEPGYLCFPPSMTETFQLLNDGIAFGENLKNNGESWQILLEFSRNLLVLRRNLVMTGNSCDEVNCPRLQRHPFHSEVGFNLGMIDESLKVLENVDFVKVFACLDNFKNSTSLVNLLIVRACEELLNISRNLKHFFWKGKLCDYLSQNVLQGDIGSLVWKGDLNEFLNLLNSASVNIIDCSVEYIYVADSKIYHQCLRHLELREWVEIQSLLGKRNIESSEICSSLMKSQFEFLLDEALNQISIMELKLCLSTSPFDPTTYQDSLSQSLDVLMKIISWSQSLKRRCRTCQELCRMCQIILACRRAVIQNIWDNSDVVFRDMQIDDAERIIFKSVGQQREQDRICGIPLESILKSLFWKESVSRLPHDIDINSFSLSFLLQSFFAFENYSSSEILFWKEIYLERAHRLSLLCGVTCTSICLLSSILESCRSCLSNNSQLLKQRYLFATEVLISRILFSGMNYVFASPVSNDVMSLCSRDFNGLSVGPIFQSFNHLVCIEKDSNYFGLPVWDVVEYKNKLEDFQNFITLYQSLEEFSLALSLDRVNICSRDSLEFYALINNQFSFLSDDIIRDLLVEIVDLCPHLLRIFDNLIVPLYHGDVFSIHSVDFGFLGKLNSVKRWFPSRLIAEVEFIAENMEPILLLARAFSHVIQSSLVVRHHCSERRPTFWELDIVCGNFVVENFTSLLSKIRDLEDKDIFGGVSINRFLDLLGFYSTEMRMIAQQNGSFRRIICNDCFVQAESSVLASKCANEAMFSALESISAIQSTSCDNNDVVKKDLKIYELSCLSESPGLKNCVKSASRIIFSNVALINKYRASVNFVGRCSFLIRNLSKNLGHIKKENVVASQFSVVSDLAFSLFKLCVDYLNESQSSPSFFLKDISCESQTFISGLLFSLLIMLESTESMEDIDRNWFVKSQLRAPSVTTIVSDIHCLVSRAYWNFYDILTTTLSYLSRNFQNPSWLRVLSLESITCSEEFCFMPLHHCVKVYAVDKYISIMNDVSILELSHIIKICDSKDLTVEDIATMNNSIDRVFAIGTTNDQILEIANVLKSMIPIISNRSNLHLIWHEISAFFGNDDEDWHLTLTKLEQFAIDVNNFNRNYFGFSEVLYQCKSSFLKLLSVCVLHYVEYKLLMTLSQSRITGDLVAIDLDCSSLFSLINITNIAERYYLFQADTTFLKLIKVCKIAIEARKTLFGEYLLYVIPDNAKSLDETLPEFKERFQPKVLNLKSDDFQNNKKKMDLLLDLISAFDVDRDQWCEYLSNNDDMYTSYIDDLLSEKVLLSSIGEFLLCQLTLETSLGIKFWDFCENGISFNRFALLMIKQSNSKLMYFIEKHEINHSEADVDHFWDIRLWKEICETGQELMSCLERAGLLQLIDISHEEGNSYDVEKSSLSSISSILYFSIFPGIASFVEDVENVALLVDSLCVLYEIVPCRKSANNILEAFSQILRFVLEHFVMELYMAMMSFHSLRAISASQNRVVKTYHIYDLIVDWNYGFIFPSSLRLFDRFQSYFLQDNIESFISDSQMQLLLKILPMFERKALKSDIDLTLRSYTVPQIREELALFSKFLSSSQSLFLSIQAKSLYHQCQLLVSFRTIILQSAYEEASSIAAILRSSQHFLCRSQTLDVGVDTPELHNLKCQHVIDMKSDIECFDRFLKADQLRSFIESSFLKLYRWGLEIDWHHSLISSVSLNEWLDSFSVILSDENSYAIANCDELLELVEILRAVMDLVKCVSLIHGSKEAHTKNFEKMSGHSDADMNVFFVKIYSSIQKLHNWTEFDVCDELTESSVLKRYRKILHNSDENGCKSVDICVETVLVRIQSASWTNLYVKDYLRTIIQQVHVYYKIFCITQSIDCSLGNVAYISSSNLFEPNSDSYLCHLNDIVSSLDSNQSLIGESYFLSAVDQAIRIIMEIRKRNFTFDTTLLQSCECYFELLDRMMSLPTFSFSSNETGMDFNVSDLSFLVDASPIFKQLQIFVKSCFPQSFKNHLQDLVEIESEFFKEFFTNNPSFPRKLLTLPAIASSVSLKLPLQVIKLVENERLVWCFSMTVSRLNDSCNIGSLRVSRNTKSVGGYDADKIQTQFISEIINDLFRFQLVTEMQLPSVFLDFDFTITISPPVFLYLYCTAVRRLRDCWKNEDHKDIPSIHLFLDKLNSIEKSDNVVYKRISSCFLQEVTASHYMLDDISSCSKVDACLLALSISNFVSNGDYSDEACLGDELDKLRRRINSPIDQAGYHLVSMDRSFQTLFLVSFLLDIRQLFRSREIERIFEKVADFYSSLDNKEFCFIPDISVKRVTLEVDHIRHMSRAVKVFLDSKNLLVDWTGIKITEISNIELGLKLNATSLSSFLELSSQVPKQYLSKEMHFIIAGIEILCHSRKLYNEEDWYALRDFAFVQCQNSIYPSENIIDIRTELGVMQIYAQYQLLLKNILFALSTGSISGQTGSPCYLTIQTSPLETAMEDVNIFYSRHPFAILGECLALAKLIVRLRKSVLEGSWLCPPDDSFFDCNVSSENLSAVIRSRWYFQRKFVSNELDLQNDLEISQIILGTDFSLGAFKNLAGTAAPLYVDSILEEIEKHSFSQLLYDKVSDELNSIRNEIYFRTLASCFLMCTFTEGPSGCPGALSSNIQGISHLRSILDFVEGDVFSKFLSFEQIRYLFRDARILFQLRVLRTKEEWAQLKRLISVCDKFSFSKCGIVDHVNRLPITVQDDLLKEIGEIGAPITPRVLREVKLYQYDCEFQMCLANFAEEMKRSYEINDYGKDVHISSYSFFESGRVSHLMDIARQVYALMLLTNEMKCSAEVIRLLDAVNLSIDLRIARLYGDNTSSIEQSTTPIFNKIEDIIKSDLNQGIPCYTLLLKYDLAKANSSAGKGVQIDILESAIYESQAYLRNDIGKIAVFDIDLTSLEDAIEECRPIMNLIGGEYELQLIRVADSLVKMRSFLIQYDWSKLRDYLDFCILEEKSLMDFSFFEYEVTRLLQECKNFEAIQTVRSEIQKNSYFSSSWNILQDIYSLEDTFLDAGVSNNGDILSHYQSAMLSTSILSKQDEELLQLIKKYTKIGFKSFELQSYLVSGSLLWILRSLVVDKQWKTVRNIVCYFEEVYDSPNRICIADGGNLINRLMDFFASEIGGFSFDSGDGVVDLVTQLPYEVAEEIRSIRTALLHCSLIYSLAQGFSSGRILVNESKEINLSTLSYSRIQHLLQENSHLITSSNNRLRVRMGVCDMKYLLDWLFLVSLHILRVRTLVDYGEWVSQDSLDAIIYGSKEKDSLSNGLQDGKSGSFSLKSMFGEFEKSYLEEALLERDFSLRGQNMEASLKHLDDLLMDIDGIVSVLSGFEHGSSRSSPKSWKSVLIESIWLVKEEVKLLHGLVLDRISCEVLEKTLSIVPEHVHRDNSTMFSNASSLHINSLSHVSHVSIVKQYHCDVLSNSLKWIASQYQFCFDNSLDHSDVTLSEETERLAQTAEIILAFRLALLQGTDLQDYEELVEFSKSMIQDDKISQFHGRLELELYITSDQVFLDYITEFELTAAMKAGRVEGKLEFSSIDKSKIDVLLLSKWISTCRGEVHFDQSVYFLSEKLLQILDQAESLWKCRQFVIDQDIDGFETFFERKYGSIDSEKFRQSTLIYDEVYYISRVFSLAKIQKQLEAQFHEVHLYDNLDNLSKLRNYVELLSTTLLSFFEMLPSCAKIASSSFTKSEFNSDNFDTLFELSHVISYVVQYSGKENAVLDESQWLLELILRWLPANSPFLTLCYVCIYTLELLISLIDKNFGHEKLAMAKNEDSIMFLDIDTFQTYDDDFNCKYGFLMDVFPGHSEIRDPLKMLSRIFVKFRSHEVSNSLNKVHEEVSKFYKLRSVMKSYGSNESNNLQAIVKRVANSSSISDNLKRRDSVSRMSKRHSVVISESSNHFAPSAKRRESVSSIVISGMNSSKNFARKSSLEILFVKNKIFNECLSLPHISMSLHRLFSSPLFSVLTMRIVEEALMLRLKQVCDVDNNIIVPFILNRGVLPLNIDVLIREKINYLDVVLKEVVYIEKETRGGIWCQSSLNIIKCVFIFHRVLCQIYYGPTYEQYVDIFDLIQLGVVDENLQARTLSTNSLWNDDDTMGFHELLAYIQRVSVMAFFRRSIFLLCEEIEKENAFQDLLSDISKVVSGVGNMADEKLRQFVRKMSENNSTSSSKLKLHELVKTMELKDEKWFEMDIVLQD